MYIDPVLLLLLFFISLSEHSAPFSFLSGEVIYVII